MYIYTFCATATVLPPLPQGIAQPLQTVAVGAVTAIGEPPLDLAALQQDEARLVSAVVHHDWVLCELVQTMPLLPLRFGTQFSDVEQVRSHLQSQAEAYRAQLTALGDRVEICLKLATRPLRLVAPLPALKGRDYFQAKKQRLQQQTLTEAQQQTQLAQLRTALIRSYPQHQIEEDSVYLLIDRKAVGQLQDQQQYWQQKFPDCEVRISGVLPPYHFV